MGWLSWMMHPAMLGLGAAAVSLPIIIHLLNKRRFKIVSWAAMDFLLDADKKNRRRVQLQHLLLLLLRCLAMLLLGLLLARPLLPSALSGLLADKPKFERVVLLDNSLSQQVVSGNLPGWEVAKQTVQTLVRDLADSADSDNWLTLYLTSNPTQPLLTNEPISVGTLATLIDTIEQLPLSEGTADYDAALAEIDRYVAGTKEGVGRIVYLLSDLRQVDWVAPAGTAVRPAPQLLRAIGEKVAAGIVVDCASPNDQNLAITEVLSDDQWVANRLVRVQARVANWGTTTQTNIRVMLQIDDQPPQYETLSSLAPQQSELVSFRTLFRPVETGSGARTPLAADAPTPRQSHRLRVELDRQALSADQLAGDQLVSDNQRFLAASVWDGIPVLLVDGDPSPVPERSETHYLKFLDVFGTGLRNDVISATELETIALTPYRVVFLCNIDELSADRVRSLEQWVRDGGAVVFMPGNQVRASTFNNTFVREGAGLCPLELQQIAGDPTLARWVNFEVSPQIHPALRTLLESDSTGLSRVDIFSWWNSRAVESSTGDPVVIPLRLNDENNSIVMAERSWGQGKVVAFSIPADGDWTMWPAITGAFVPVMLDLVDYLLGAGDQRNEIPMGGNLTAPVDVSLFDSRASLRDPQDERSEAVARPRSEEPQAERDTVYQVQFDRLSRSGFYELELQRTAGPPESQLFAVNVPSAESQLALIPREQLNADFWGEQFALVSPEQLGKQTAPGTATEFWPQVIGVLLFVLASEQFCGWWFGRHQ